MEDLLAPRTFPPPTAALSTEDSPQFHLSPTHRCVIHLGQPAIPPFPNPPLRYPQRTPSPQFRPPLPSQPSTETAWWTVRGACTQQQ
eukprot:365911-Chlamydomonas_euryale.AAC.12